MRWREAGWRMWRRIAIWTMVLFALGVFWCVILAPGFQNPAKFFENRRSNRTEFKVESLRVVNGLKLESVQISGIREKLGGEYRVEVKAYTCRPESRDATLPAFLLIGGLHTGREVIQIISSRPNVANLGVFLALDYPYSGPLEFEGLDILPHIPEIRRALFDGVEAVRLGIDFLEAQESVDRSRIVLIGVSLGAFYAVDAGGADARVAAVMSFMGGGGQRSILEWNLRRNGFISSPWLSEPISFLADWLIRPLETTRLVGEISPRPYIQVSARNDEMVPECNALALYQASREPHRLIWLSTPHVMPGMEEIIEKMIAVAYEELNRWGILQTRDLQIPESAADALPLP